MKTRSAKEYLKKRMKSKSFTKAYDEVGFLVKIGVAISEMREKLGLSQTQLAKLLKTTQSVISRIENGNQNLSITMLTAIARVLKCSLAVQMNHNRMAA